MELYFRPTLADETALRNTTHHGMRVVLGVLLLVTANFAYQAPTFDVKEHLAKKDASNDDLGKHFNFFWDKGFDWPHVGHNYSQTCHLVHNGTREFAPFHHELRIECDECSITRGSRVFVERHRLIGNQIFITFRIEHLELEDTGTYKCVWNFNKKRFKIIDYELHVAPTKPQIKLIERSPQVLRVKEGKQTSLSAEFAVYPLDVENYTATWSRTYNSSIKDGPQSETIITDELRIVSAKSLENGVLAEILEFNSGAMATNMSGKYRLFISHMNTSQNVQWEVLIENEQPDVHITVREPSSFIFFNQQFYPPGTHLHVDCVSISIPSADVTFERKNRENGNFEEIDRKSMMSVGGTFERRLVWNMTLDEDTELRCTSTRNGNKYTAMKSIMVADEAFKIFSSFEKSDKATSLELPNVIYDGDNVKLTCVVPNGATDWDVFWRFENTSLELSNTEVKGHSKLVMFYLKDITTNSSGNYQCVVKKGESEEFQEVALKVESISKPYHTDAESRSAVTVNYDETFVIDCGLTGNPLPDIIWIKDKNLYKGGEREGNLLKVSRARAEDDGKFQCLAMNRAGSTSNFIEVQVENVPKRTFFLYWVILILVALVVFVCIACIAVISCLSHKLFRNKMITKQKDIELKKLHEMKNREPEPMPEHVKQLPIEERTDYLPYPRKFEIAREKLEINEKIGSGNFGSVKKGLLSMADPKNPTEHRRRLPVAIKSTKHSSDVELQTMLYEELIIMCAIEKHPNVIALIGAVTTNLRKGELYLVTEYADNGDLLNYLRKHRETFHNTLIDRKGQVINENYSILSQQTESTRLLPPGYTLSTLDLLSFAFQIANGMLFLAGVPCVHRDLAARNVLITSNKICRIADFGLAKRYTDKNYYRAKPAALPVRWMAPEAVETYKFTEKTDVWSYGITLYEIFTLGCRPYSQVPDEELEAFLKNGKRNEQPKYCHDEVYALMNNCWHKSPGVRPDFNTCFHYLKGKNKPVHNFSITNFLLLARVDEQLDMDLENQYKLGEWLMKNRSEIQERTRRPSNNEKPHIERYLNMESSA
ncbi:hypothetical protein B9Z55_023327 [Caenorhabditis nigoni]|uniref:receptor protein-tyrosine kinase n=1 Tax=Caenorhabditis nigoni TaxID=1611254 RepID=A0A2G5SPP2_9PELO|nr:hypothetical protein B9Z55_023327 [Caenorhabditis nigoni]